MTCRRRRYFKEQEFFIEVETVSSNVVAAHLQQLFQLVPHQDQEALLDTIKAMKTI
jgi:hypothetical protein